MAKIEEKMRKRVKKNEQSNFYSLLAQNAY